MDKILTAEEARNQTNSSKRKMGDIMNSIQAMAEAGFNYATIETIKIGEPENIKKELENLGYTIKLSERFFEVNW